MVTLRLLVVLLLALVVACDPGAVPTEMDEVLFSSSQDSESNDDDDDEEDEDHEDDDDDDGDEGEAEGSGVYLFSTSSFGDIPTQFVFEAETEDGAAEGYFRQTLVVAGSLIDVTGVVTCLAVDEANGRAWIGGVVTENNSEAFFTRDIHQPGRDVWFRVLDDENGDRSTLFGFEGGGGIITSEEYCTMQPWPDDNARTHAVVEGKIEVDS